MKPHLNILGTRGIPANHGGFETFASHLSQYLTRHGWSVSVYCQHDQCQEGKDFWEDDWNGIHRINFAISRNGPIGTIIFDWKCVKDCLKRPGIDLVLGYNTAVINVLQRLWRRKLVINMDGVEWRRQKWGPIAKHWVLF